MYTDILIPEEFLNGAKIGQKVFGKIISWENSKKAPEGKIIKILGQPGDNNTEMIAIALEKGFNEKLSDEVEKEGKTIGLIGIKRRFYRKTRF